MCCIKNNSGIVAAEWFLNSGSSGSVATDDTTADGKQAFLIIGDSIAGDTSSSEALGPTTPAGSTYLWNGTDITELTTADLNNAGPTYGTPWKKFALDYNARTGFKPVFINEASAGSEFYPNGDNNNWFTSGTLYAAAVAQANACLSYLGLTKLRRIIIVGGVNDASGGQSLSNIQSAITSLIDRLSADFPGVEIRIVSIGKTAGSFITDRGYAIRGYIMDASVTYDHVHVFSNLHCYYDWGLMDADESPNELHLSQVGNNFLGAQLDRYEANTETNKVVRQVQNSFYSSLTAQQKTAVKNAIEGMDSDGNWDLLDHLQVYHPAEMEDKIVDWTMLLSGRRRGNITGDGNNYIATDGVSGTSVSTNFAPVYARRASQNDFLKGVKTVVVGISAGTAGNLHTGGSNMQLRSSASNVLSYFSMSGTGLSWSGGDTQFQNNTDYGQGRTVSTTGLLYKNGAQVHSGAATSNAPDSTVIQIGASAADSLPMPVQAKYSFYARNSGFNYAAFISRMNTFFTEWGS